MARSEVIRADLERIRGMSDEEFAEQWGEWARQADRELAKVKDRWVSDLEWNLEHAELEEDALAELVAAKDAYRADQSPANKARRQAAMDTVREIRQQERSRPGRQMVAGDAFSSTGA